ncbi:hypothetical protein BKA82DRAFT_1005373 [Pisolithus tinctorius]|uniref:Uncharacterized protein n=1 Tax=Pisolithus tinctorius Marx 270 TaxID=870435 RepID=A0A0C3NBA9_PISTI|nr:hypothetical protein BKA82DRAFT_1005373 [Pisolithus tinctorius]KIN98394.1 hypothetical protein M404DRAFT_1005373 [Pisolithus tinctorius Marx 270]
MSEPRHPITLLADLPSLPGIYLECDDTPFLHEAFPIRHHRSKAHLAWPGVSNYITSAAHHHHPVPSRCLIDEPTTLPRGRTNVHMMPTKRHFNVTQSHSSNLTSNNCSIVMDSSNHRAPAPPVILCTTALQDSEFDQATLSLVSPSDNCPHVDISSNHRMSTPLDAVSPASPSEPSSWPLKCMRKAIRSQKECVTFYKSSTSGSLDFPPSAPEAFEYCPKPADIYVHHDEAHNITQVWIWSGDQWTKAGVDICHPTLPGYRLKLLDSGEPSWVTRKR